MVSTTSYLRLQTYYPDGSDVSAQVDDLSLTSLRMYDLSSCVIVAGGGGGAAERVMEYVAKAVLAGAGELPSG
jgi:hypothetical protein